MVSTGYNEDAREQFVSGLEAFDEMAREEHGSSYADLDPEVQFQFADDQNRAAIGGEYGDEPGTALLLVMKELTLMGYFTSEIGATQTLQYVKVPGRFEACIPFEEVGKTWAI
jgi:gluconate 2-dehydrogenase gamma chain